MKTRIKPTRAKVAALGTGDIISVPSNLMYASGTYRSDDNIVTRLLEAPFKHHRATEYWVLVTTYGEYYVPSAGYVDRLKEIPILR